MEATEERSSTCQWGGKGATPSPRRRKFWFLPHPLRTFVQRRCFFYYPSRKSARQKPKHKYLGGGGRVCGREEFPRAPLRQGRDRQWVKSGEGGRKKSPPQLINWLLTISFLDTSHYFLCGICFLGIIRTRLSLVNG